MQKSERSILEFYEALARGEYEWSDAAQGWIHKAQDDGCYGTITVIDDSHLNPEDDAHMLMREDSDIPVFLTMPLTEEMLSELTTLQVKALRDQIVAGLDAVKLYDRLFFLVHSASLSDKPVVKEVGTYTVTRYTVRRRGCEAEYPVEISQGSVAYAVQGKFFSPGPWFEEFMEALEQYERTNNSMRVVYMAELAPSIAGKPGEE